MSAFRDDDLQRFDKFLIFWYCDLESNFEILLSKTFDILVVIPEYESDVFWKGGLPG